MRHLLFYMGIATSLATQAGEISSPPPDYRTTVLHDSGTSLITITAYAGKERVGVAKFDRLQNGISAPSGILWALENNPHIFSALKERLLNCGIQPMDSTRIQLKIITGATYKAAFSTLAQYNI